MGTYGRRSSPAYRKPTICSRSRSHSQNAIRYSCYTDSDGQSAERNFCIYRRCPFKHSPESTEGKDSPNSKRILRKSTRTRSNSFLKKSRQDRKKHRHYPCTFADKSTGSSYCLLSPNHSSSKHLLYSSSSKNLLKNSVSRNLSHHCKLRRLSNHSTPRNSSRDSALRKFSSQDILSNKSTSQRSYVSSRGSSRDSFRDTKQFVRKQRSKNNKLKGDPGVVSSKRIQIKRRSYERPSRQRKRLCQDSQTVQTVQPVTRSFGTNPVVIEESLVSVHTGTKNLSPNNKCLGAVLEESESLLSNSTLSTAGVRNLSIDVTKLRDNESNKTNLKGKESSVANESRSITRNHSEKDNTQNDNCLIKFVNNKASAEQPHPVSLLLEEELKNHMFECSSTHGSGERSPPHSNENALQIRQPSEPLNNRIGLIPISIPIYINKGALSEHSISSVWEEGTPQLSSLKLLHKKSSTVSSYLHKFSSSSNVSRSEIFSVYRSRSTSTGSDYKCPLFVENDTKRTTATQNNASKNSVTFNEKSNVYRVSENTTSRGSRENNMTERRGRESIARRTLRSSQSQDIPPGPRHSSYPHDPANATPQDGPRTSPRCKQRGSARSSPHKSPHSHQRSRSRRFSPTGSRSRSSRSRPSSRYRSSSRSPSRGSGRSRKRKSSSSPRSGRNKSRSPKNKRTHQSPTSARHLGHQPHSRAQSFNFLQSSQRVKNRHAYCPNDHPKNKKRWCSIHSTITPEGEGSRRGRPLSGNESEKGGKGISSKRGRSDKDWRGKNHGYGKGKYESGVSSESDMEEGICKCETGPCGSTAGPCALGGYLEQEKCRVGAAVGMISAGVQGSPGGMQPGSNAMYGRSGVNTGTQCPCERMDTSTQCRLPSCIGRSGSTQTDSTKRTNHAQTSRTRIGWMSQENAQSQTSRHNIATNTSPQEFDQTQRSRISRGAGSALAFGPTWDDARSCEGSNTHQPCGGGGWARSNTKSTCENGQKYPKCTVGTQCAGGARNWPGPMNGRQSQPGQSTSNTMGNRSSDIDTPCNGPNYMCLPNTGSSGPVPIGAGHGGIGSGSLGHSGSGISNTGSSNLGPSNIGMSSRGYPSVGNSGMGQQNVGNSGMGHTTIGTSTMGHCRPVGTSNVGHSTVGTSGMGYSTIGPSTIGHSTTGPSSIGHSTIGPSSIGHSMIGASSIGHLTIAPSKLGHSTIGISNMGHTNIGPSSIGHSNFGSSNLGPCGLAPPMMGSSGVGTSNVGPSPMGSNGAVSVNVIPSNMGRGTIGSGRGASTLGCSLSFVGPGGPTGGGRSLVGPDGSSGGGWQSNKMVQQQHEPPPWNVVTQVWPTQLLPWASWNRRCLSVQGMPACAAPPDCGPNPPLTARKAAEIRQAHVKQRLIGAVFARARHGSNASKGSKSSKSKSSSRGSSLSRSTRGSSVSSSIRGSSQSKKTRGSSTSVKNRGSSRSINKQGSSRSINKQGSSKSRNKQGSSKTRNKRGTSMSGSNDGSSISGSSGGSSMSSSGSQSSGSSQSGDTL